MDNSTPGTSAQNWSSLCVLVTGLNEHTPNAADLLKTYFQDGNRSGGGLLQEPVYFVATKSAIICFAESRG